MQLPSAANPAGFNFIELQSVDSTNKYAMSLVHEGVARHGTAVFAHEQTAGKGQRGRFWASQKGANIALSLILNPSPLMVSEVFYLSIWAAVSLQEFFCRYAGEETKIKWPNDLYWRDRKAGGILIENLMSGGKTATVKPGIETESWKWSVTGIGVNVNQVSFPPELPNPVSLKQITGKNFEPLLLARELCSVLEKNFVSLISGNQEKFFKTYQDILYKKEELVKLKKGSRVFETTIQGVTAKGQLITRHGIEEKFEFGEVEWIR